MAFRTLLNLLGLSLLLTLSGCATRQLQPPLPITVQGSLKQSHYQMRMTTDDGITLSFTVYQPKLARGQTAPLIIHTHGFGLSRMKRPYLSLYGSIMPTGQGAEAAWKRGYWVISFDQRGHGGLDGTGGKIRLTDPQFEGRDVSRMIDWAEQHLPQLARNEHGARVGMIGESYGGAVQYIASAQDKRIAAIVPVTTWYNLEYSLAPNGVPKSGWLDLLNVVGDWWNWNKFDPALKMAYQDTKNGAISASSYQFLKTHQARWFCDTDQPPQADALIIQGFRDVLFPFNEGISAYQCLKHAGHDVRLLGVDGGHLQPGVQHSPGLELPAWYIGKNMVCQGKTLNIQTMIADWFDAKLKDQPLQAKSIPHVCIDHSPVQSLDGLQPQVNYPLPDLHINAGGGYEWLFKTTDRLRHLLTPQHLPANWNQPKLGGQRPLLLPLTRLSQDQWLTGIPRLHLNIDTSDPAIAQSSPTLFVSLARWTPGKGSYQILNEQVLPINLQKLRYRNQMLSQLQVPIDDPAKGIDLPAVNAKLKQGEILGLVISSRSRYFGRSSTAHAEANISGYLELPKMLPASPAHQ
ncbi:MAG: peptidase S15 [Moraxellaceae bacterium]|nr:MAG: peptidase S15 [Moraxellaceae bacterium]